MLLSFLFSSLIFMIPVSHKSFRLMSHRETLLESLALQWLQPLLWPLSAFFFFLASTCSLARLALVIYERREKLNKAACSSCGISEAFPSVNQNITNCLRFCPTSSPKPGYDRKKKKSLSRNSHFPGHSLPGLPAALQESL